MSIFGALKSGISGLTAQSSAMGAISDNITNVNTVGYKGTDTQFSTLVTKQTSSSLYSPGGVQSMPTQEISKQGLLSPVSSSTSMGISGDGFFVVNTAANPSDSDMWAYTRAGDFSIDNQGYLVNTGGFYLQGWSLLPYDGNPNASIVEIGGVNYMKAYYDTNGDTVYINDNIVDNTNLKPINLTSIGGTATPTKQISYGANLPSGDPIYNPADAAAGGRHSVSALIYDSLGNASNIALNYTKTSANGWEMSSSIPSGSATVSLTGTNKNGSLTPDVYSAMGQLEFTGIPENGSSVVVNGTSYYFTNGGVLPATAPADSVAVNLDGLLSTNDFTKAFAEQLQNTQLSGDRFQADGERVLITQSTMGESISIDASKTTNCVQTATNPHPDTGLPTGQFTIDAISDNIKNGAVMNFSTNPAVGNTITLGGVTFEFVAGAPAAGTAQVQVGATLKETMDNLDSAIKGNADEPSRFVISGSSLEILPSGSGGDITFSTTVAGVDGRYRPGSEDPATGVVTSGDWVNYTGGDATVCSKFYANGLDTALEEGSIVPSVRFNANGTPKYFYTDAMNIVWSNGAENMGAGVDPSTPITLFSGNVGTSDGLTSLSGAFSTNYNKQDGAKFGTYSDVFVDESGIVTALFDNGETRPIAILPLATFANDEGMESLSGNSWIATDYSGDAVLKRATTNGSGSIQSQSLESSTVDIATEFSNMIVTQRAYSAATQIITTSDEMLQELTNMV